LNLGEIVKKSGDKCIVKIVNPTINIYKLDKSALEKLPELLFIEGMDVIKEDIATEEAFVINNIKNVLREIRPYLSGEYYGALSYASYIVKLEDKGEDVKELLERLFETYGPRGMRIYSLLRSGIFNEEILPLIKEREDEREVRNHINKMITAPEAIFVSRFMAKDDVKREIKNRFSRDVNSFQIFARAGRVEIAIEATKEIIEEMRDVLCKIEPYPLGKSDAVTIYIQKFTE